MAPKTIAVLFCVSVSIESVSWGVMEEEGADGEEAVEG